MGRRSNPARLVLALSVAAVLAVFLVYVSLAGGGTPAIQPSELDGRTQSVILMGEVVRPVREVSENVHRFRLRDLEGTGTIAVSYASTLPDQFRPGREIRLEGRLRGGVFVGVPGTMITKCPSKYAPNKS